MPRAIAFERKANMVQRVALKMGLVAAGVALAVGFGAVEAQARAFVAVGIGVPLFPPPYYYPPPVVYAPPPVVYAPPVVVMPATPSYVQQPQQSWYYCDNPQGYYPYVSSCTTAWRQVPAAPPQQ
jgi:hypothetical protein